MRKISTKHDGLEWFFIQCDYSHFSSFKASKVESGKKELNFSLRGYRLIAVGELMCIISALLFPNLALSLDNESANYCHLTYYYGDEEFFPSKFRCKW